MRRGQASDFLFLFSHSDAANIIAKYRCRSARLADAAETCTCVLTERAERTPGVAGESEPSSRVYALRLTIADR